MSFQVSAVATPSLNPAAEINRRSANFRPSLWGDRFLTYTSEFLLVQETDHEKIQQQLQELKKEVRKMLMAPGQKSSQKLNFIDAIQRLGVSYHFEIEIQQILRQLHKSALHDSHDHEDDDDDDLYTVALRFRLLRQHGYNVLSDMFAKFKDNNGNFKESLVNDAQGMLSLYEAAHLRVHGEDILDEALVFTTTHLESVAAHLSPLLAAQVSHALKKPIHKGLPRLEARYYFSIFQQDASHNEVLLAFAKLDFNILQKLHQKELSEISRWWKDLNLAGKLPFIRDRVVECYFWILGVYFEPEYLLARRLLTKVIAMTSAIDDIYDVYGTLEELELFTEAIERWDTGATNQLPEYMKLCYRALLDVYTEMGQKIGEEKLYRVQYAREAMKNQVRSYFKEAKWFHQKYTPTVTEYMHTAIVSSGYPLLAITSFVGMGDIVTKDSFEWLCSQPKAVTASSVIARLMDDMMSHKFEQKRGHVASAVECYMIEHGATEEEAIKEFWKQVTDAWKDVNEECLYPTAIPMPPVMPILNLTRVCEVIYKDQDNYTNPGDGLIDFVSSLLIDPVPL